MLALFPFKKLKKQVRSSLCTGFLSFLKEKITTPSGLTYLIRFTNDFIPSFLSIHSHLAVYSHYTPPLWTRHNRLLAQFRQNHLRL